MHHMENYIDECVPKGRPPKNRKNYMPIDPKLKTKINNKYRLWHRYMETRNSKKYREYTRLKNQIRNQTRKNRKNIEKTIAEKIKNKPKAFGHMYTQRQTTVLEYQTWNIN